MNELQEHVVDLPLAERAIVYDAGPPPIFNGALVTEEMEATFPFVYRLRIELRLTTGGKKKWVITDGREVMNHQKGEFEYEGLPSNRTDAKLKRTRFDSAEEAFAFWWKWRTKQIAKFEH